MALINLDCKFCNQCGGSQIDRSENFEVENWRLLKITAVFYAIYIVVCCAANFIDSLNTTSWNIFFEIILAITSVSFFAVNWKENKVLLTWRSFSLIKLIGYIFIAILCSVVVNVFMSWFNSTIFNSDLHFDSWFKTNIYTKILLVFIIAVLPAIFEELAFRGYLLRAMLTLTGTDQAIYLSAFLFAIIHLNILSLVWLIPFALFLGFIRVKEDTLWYGIFIHFFFNLIACLIDFL